MLMCMLRVGRVGGFVIGLGSFGATAKAFRMGSIFADPVHTRRCHFQSDENVTCFGRDGRAVQAFSGNRSTKQTE